MRKSLNLGSGRDFRESTDDEEWTNVEHPRLQGHIRADKFVNLDSDSWWLAFSKDHDAAMVGLCDTTEQYDYCLIRHVVEHIADLHGFMESLYRIMAPASKVEIHAPYYTHHWCWGDPDHKRAINEMTFQFFSKDYDRLEVERDSMATPMFASCDFRVIEMGYSFADKQLMDWYNSLPPKYQELVRLHVPNVICEIRIKLEVVK